MSKYETLSGKKVRFCWHFLLCFASSWYLSTLSSHFIQRQLSIWFHSFSVSFLEAPKICHRHRCWISLCSINLHLFSHRRSCLKGLWRTLFFKFNVYPKNWFEVFSSASDDFCELNLISCWKCLRCFQIIIIFILRVRLKKFKIFQRWEMKILIFSVVFSN